MEPFEHYPYGGRTLLGPRRGANARHEYGLRLQQLTGQTHCTWCGINLVEDYYRWLLLCLDHVIPTQEAARLGIPVTFSDDYMNLVIACSGCNGFDNQYRSTREPQAVWNLDEFVEFRDEIFRERRPRIAQRRAQELAFFEGQPWQFPRL